jgi:hypothetical protein
LAGSRATEIIGALGSMLYTEAGSGCPMETEKYLTTYTADNSDSFWACGVTNCKIPFAHVVEFTQDHKWEHVFADFYYSEPKPDSRLSKL